MTVTPEQRMREAILDGVRRKLDAMPDDRFAHIEDPAAVSERMAELVPESGGEFSQLIGPVYSTKALTLMWGVTRAAVSKKAKVGQILAIKVEGENLFPVFQFSGSSVRTDVMRLAELLRGAADPATIALWFRTPIATDSTRRTPLQMLDAGDTDAAVAAALQTTHRWAA